METLDVEFELAKILGDEYLSAIIKQIKDSDRTEEQKEAILNFKFKYFTCLEWKRNAYEVKSEYIHYNDLWKENYQNAIDCITLASIQNL